jgi:hypothetical protein
LTVNLAAERAKGRLTQVLPKSGDLITKRIGTAPETRHVVRQPVTLTLDAVLTLTIGPEHG